MLIVVCSCAFASERAQAVLREHKNEIIEASKSFGISPRLLASIVYAEQSLNVKPGEDLLDKVFAMSGYNASVGIAQIKVETALWIRKQILDKNSEFYSSTGSVALTSSASSDIVDQLDNPQTNLLYAAAYIKIIYDVWQPLLRETAYQKNTTGIIGTLYCLGLVRTDGSFRRLHVGAHMNRFGEVAQAFYDSFELAEKFPP